MDWIAHEILNERVGLVGGAMLLVFAFMKEIIVPGNALRRSQQRVELLERLLLEAVGVTRDAVTTARDIVNTADREGSNGPAA